MLQQIVQKVHALDFLLEICAAIDIQRKGHILMPQNLGERFDVKLWYFDCPYCESVPDLVELYLLQPVSFQKTGKELPVCARLGWLGLTSQEVMVGILRIEFLDNVHEQRRNRNCTS